MLNLDLNLWWQVEHAEGGTLLLKEVFAPHYGLSQIHDLLFFV
jgi:hypothetical protein